MKTLIINSAEQGINEFYMPFCDILNELNTDFTVIEYSEIISTDFKEFDAIIMTGSPRGNDIVDSHLPLYNFIKEWQKPLLGVCAGHHILGSIYGSSLIRDIEKEVGEHMLYIDKPNFIFNKKLKKIIVQQNHHDSISLPDDFILLAHSEKCKNEAMKHKSLPYFSTQFHPEILNSDIIENFINFAYDYTYNK